MSENYEENFKIFDESSLHKYRTEHPNIIYDMELDPYEGWLYSHLKRIAGDEGACFKSLSNLSKATKMSITKIKEVKKILEIKGLIKIKKRTKKDGSADTDFITINDLWPANFQRFFNNEVSRHKTEGQSPQNGGVGRDTATKKNPCEEEPIKKKENASDDAIFCSNYLFEKLLKKRPERKKPDIEKWAKEVDIMFKNEKRTKEKIIEMIDWLFETENLFVVDSVFSLRKKYDNIADHMIRQTASKPNFSASVQDVKSDELMYKIHDVYLNKYRSSCQAINVQDNCLQLIDGYLIDSKIKYRAKATLDKLIDRLKNGNYINKEGFKNCLSIELKEALTIWNTSNISNERFKN